MTHLFDKVASVTDCRSTGHFVLPKRKVEVYLLVWIDDILRVRVYLSASLCRLVAWISVYVCELDMKYKWACRVLLQEHFPPLSKPGGVWMTLVDASGKEWSFEFCFWHSKDSRIYYFKKFYPYVQATDLRGGDTGTYIIESFAFVSALTKVFFLSFESLNKIIMAASLPSSFI